MKKRIGYLLLIYQKQVYSNEVRLRNIFTVNDYRDEIVVQYFNCAGGVEKGICGVPFLYVGDVSYVYENHFIFLYSSSEGLFREGIPHYSTFQEFFNVR